MSKSDDKSFCFVDPVFVPTVTSLSILLTSTALALGLTLIAPQIMQAQAWDGSTDGNFLTGTNWAGDVAPGAANNFVLNSGAIANQPTLGSAGTATVNSGLVSAGTLAVNGNLTTATGLTVSGTGIITVGAGGSLTGGLIGSGGTATNLGTINAVTSTIGTFTNGAGGGVTGLVTTNGGTVVLAATSSTGSLTNISGTTSVAGSIGGNTSVSGGTVTLAAGADLADASTVAVSGTGTLTVNAADTVAAVTQAGGIINGSNTLTTTTFGQSSGNLAGTISASGAKTLSGGIISGTLTGAGATTIQTGTATVSGTIVGNVTVASGTLRLDSSNAINGSITTTGSVISYANGVNEASTLIVNSNTTQLEVSGTDQATQSGVISELSGPRPVEKIGVGTLTLSGANTYTGETTVTAGTLIAANNAALGTTAGGTTVVSGATLALSGGITTGDAITLNGTGAGGLGALRNLSGNNTVSGQITVATDARITSSTNQLGISGGITGAGTNLNFAGTGRTFITSAITTGAGSLTVDTTTATGVVALWGTNTFTGGTTVNSGFLQLAGGLALADSGALTINSPGTVQVFAGETVGDLSGNGTITLQTADALVAGGSGNTTFSGAIGEFGAVGAFTKGGSGNLTLSGTNTYTGATTANAGTMIVTGSVASSVVAVNTGASLQVAGAAIADTAAVTLNGTGNLTLTGSETIGSLASASTTATVTLGANTLTTGGNNGTTTFAGMVSGNGGLTKQGSGVFTLSGVNSYSGATTVTAGSLIIAAAGSIANSITTNSGGIITNNGVMGGVNNTTGTFTNNLTAGAVTNGATATNTGTIGSLTSTGGTFGNTGTVSGATAISGGTVTNNGGTFAAVINTAGIFTNATGSAGAITNGATATNAGTIASLANTGGTFGNTGTVSGASSVSGGTVTNTGGFSGTLAVTGGNFANNPGGSVSGATSIGAGGSVVNGGTMAAVSNAGSFANTLTAGALINTGAGTGTNTGTLASLAHNSTAGFANSGAVSGNVAVSAGTVAHTGTIGGTATVTGGALAVTGGSITGATANNGGTVTIASGTFTGGLTNSATGTVNAGGTMTGNIVNNGAFNVTTALTAGGATFANNGTLNVIVANYTGLGAITNTSFTTINVGAARVLAGTSLVNTGRTVLTIGTIAAAFTNSVGAILETNGTSTITGSLTNNGIVDLANGSTGDRLTISGATGGSGRYQMDLNLSNGTTDLVTATAGGVSAVRLDFTATPGGALLAPITVFAGAGAGAVLAQTGLPTGGAVLYAMNQNGSNVQVVSQINPAVGGVAASAATTQSLIGTIVNRPTSPFVSGLAGSESCSHGGYLRGSTGIATVKGNSTNNAISTQSTISSQFSGVQGGYDVGCYDGRFFDGWDGVVGALIGYNAGSTNQDVFSDPITPTLRTGTSGADFKQSYFGIYAAGSKDRFSGDIQLRFDTTKFDLSETAFTGTPVGLDGLSYATKSTTVGTRFNYRLDLNEEKGTNFVPTIGFNYTSVTGDTLTLAGGETLEISPFNTVVGFIGGTFAQTKISPEGTSATTTFISGNLYQDFGGDRKSVYSSAALPGPATINIGSIGAFAEASIGVNYLKILENGPGGAKQLNASVRADARFGASVSDSYSLTAQVRYSF